MAKNSELQPSSKRCSHFVRAGRSPVLSAGKANASRSRGSSRRSPNRVRRSFASGLEKDLCLPLEGRGETDSCGICWMRWKASRSHPSGRIQVKTPHQPPWRRSLNKVRRSFWQTSPQGEAFGLRCRYGSWSPVGTVQDRSSLSLRSVMDACHRHASPETAVENGAGRVPPARSALSLPLEGRGETDSLRESAG